MTTQNGNPANHLFAYAVEEYETSNGKKAKTWTRIGAAFPHKDGTGFNVQLRAFVQLRELLASNTELARRLDELEARIEKKLSGHGQAIAAMLSAIRGLMKPSSGAQRGIGFTADLGEPKRIRR